MTACAWICETRDSEIAHVDLRGAEAGDLQQQRLAGMNVGRQLRDDGLSENLDEILAPLRWKNLCSQNVANGNLRLQRIRGHAEVDRSLEHGRFRRGYAGGHTGERIDSGHRATPLRR